LERLKSSEIEFLFFKGRGSDRKRFIGGGTELVEMLDVFAFLGEASLLGSLPGADEQTCLRRNAHSPASGLSNGLKTARFPLPLIEIVPSDN